MTFAGWLASEASVTASAEARTYILSGNAMLLRGLGVFVCLGFFVLFSMPVCNKQD